MKTMSRTLSGKLIQYDSFGEPFRFKLANGSKNYHTMIGFMLTFLMVVIILYYSSLNSIKLFLRDDPDIKESVQHFYYNSEDVFSDTLGFRFATTLISYKH